MRILYDRHYFQHYCGEHPYQRDDEWFKFFGNIAERIAREIRPRTVLDAGCAMGFLVEALRHRGIEAFGLDISEYAIGQVHPDIRQYCSVGTVTTPLQDRYDLIVCIEVLEHLSAWDAERAIENFSRQTDDVLFSSTPLDFKETTHVHVRPPEYWAERFAQYGLYRDVDFDASFIAPWAHRFRRARDPVARVIAAYERRLWQLEQENRASRETALENRHALSQQEEVLRGLREELEARRTRLGTLKWELRWLYAQVRRMVSKAKRSLTSWFPLR